MDRKKLVSLLLFVGVYLLSSFASYSLFSKTISATDSDDNVASVDEENTNDYEAVVFDPKLPKTEACPLNGAKWSKEQRKWWESHRPLGVMIENSTDARPQSGISFADVVYEAVAEGGITRFLAVFYCQDAGIVGPVRSARTYFLDFISEYGDYPLYAHVGGANTPGPADALGQIQDYGWGNYNDMNQFSIGFPTFKRDESRAGRAVATEHTMYSITNKLWQFAKEERDLTHVDEDGNNWEENFTPYEFKDDAPAGQRGNMKSVHVEHWDGYDDFFVDWMYNKESNTFARKNGGEAHNDRNTGKQITTKSVVVLYMRESRANDGYEGNLHMLYGTKGTGNADIFMDGKQIKAKWSKQNREARLVLTANGEEVEFNRGLIWFHVVAPDSTVEVE